MRTPRSHTKEQGSAAPANGPRQWASLLLLTLALTASAAAKTKAKDAPKLGSNIELKATMADALKAVEEVAADPILHGTYVYEHDKTLVGARPADKSSAFGNDRPEGKIFHKVLDDVIAPRYFKDTGDSGTITVRYVVRELNPQTVGIRIEAVFVESAHRAVHPSEGAVESAEFGQVQEHLNRIQAREKEALEDARQETQPEFTPRHPPPEAQAPVPAASGPDAEMSLPPAGSRPLPSAGAEASTGSVAELEQAVDRLRHQVEARVKEPGAPLKSAPFHTATTIQSVPAGSEVAIVILTTYWYGVQTTDGHTGWIPRSQLESLP